MAIETEGEVEEAVEAKPLSTKELAAQVALLTEKLASVELAARVAAVRGPTTLPQALTTEQILAQRLTPGQSASGQRRRDHTGQELPFKDGDIVALVEEKKLKRLQEVGMAKPDEDFLGVVKAFLFRRQRDNLTKWSVEFPGMDGDGHDSIMEDGLRLVQAAP